MSNHNDKNELKSGKLLASNVEDNPEPSQICRICKRDLTYVHFHKSRTNKNGLDYRCKRCKKKLAHKERKNNYFGSYISTKRSECKTKGIKFNLTEEYLRNIWTGICPICGITLSHNKGKGSHHKTSAHLDRVIPDKGYIIGNVVWISGRMNRIKYDATIEELENILAYMKGATTIPKGSTP